MPLVDRRLLVDRPTVTDPVIGGEDSAEEQDKEADEIEVFGEGGGKTVHGIEFGKDQDEIIKASNLVAMLATGDDEPNKVFKDVFANAAIQLNHLKAADEDVSGISELSDRIDASSIGGIVWEDTQEDSEDVVVETEETDKEITDPVEEDTEDSDSSEENSEEDDEWFDEEEQDEETTEG